MVYSNHELDTALRLPKLKTLLLELVIVCFALLTVSCNENALQAEQGGDIAATVFIPRGVIQCEANSGLTIESSEQALINAGIDVMSSQCAVNHLIDVMDACSAGTADIIIHTIPERLLVEANNLGYVSTDTIDNEYSIVECE